jgi:hypothetical protein
MNFVSKHARLSIAASIAAAVSMTMSFSGAAVEPKPIHRMPDGKPDFSGVYTADHGGGNYGLEKHEASKGNLTPPGRGIIVDPPDGKLPMLPWARAEQQSRALPEGAYDDPSVHCFPDGVPRSMYHPQPIQVVQPAGYLVLLFERMYWRVVPLDNRPHLPDKVRLWQGDSVGHWEGDSLVIDVTNFNGKTWLNENGEIVSHAEHVVERLTPEDADTITYEATITDPVVYSRPWTIRFPLRRSKDQLLEQACHEDNQELQFLKDVKDAAAAAKKNAQ